MDTKKKELLGNFYRDGKIDTQETIETNDHDFGSAGSVAIPHGLYDVGKNQGFVHLNTSHDTSELACDSIAEWWGSRPSRLPRGQETTAVVRWRWKHSATRYVFKEGIQKLAIRLGIEIQCPLPAILLKAQPNRASLVSTSDSGLPRSDFPHFRDREVLHG